MSDEEYKLELIKLFKQAGFLGDREGWENNSAEFGFGC